MASISSAAATICQTPCCECSGVDNVGSDVKWPSVPDDARPGPLLTQKINKDRPEAKPNEFGILAMYKDGIKDDLTGQPLPDELVRDGKRKELVYFGKKGV